MQNIHGTKRAVAQVYNIIGHLSMEMTGFMQKQFSELLMKAASDYGSLTESVADFQWSQNFKEPPSVWGVWNCLFISC